MSIRARALGSLIGGRSGLPSHIFDIAKDVRKAEAVIPLPLPRRRAKSLFAGREAMGRWRQGDPIGFVSAKPKVDPLARYATGRKYKMERLRATQQAREIRRRLS